jgi:hypothetical protein
MMTVRAVSNWIGALQLCYLFCRLHDDGTVAPKHAGVGIYRDLYFMICFLLYLIESVCWLIDWIYGLFDDAVTALVSL